MAFAEPTIDYSKVPYAAATNEGGVNRFSRRVEHIYARHADRLRGKRVLDLACNTGRLAYPILMLGATSVVGVEARRELIDKGEAIFRASPFADRMRFVESDLFDFLDRANPGDFDVICCTGFLYHTVRHADFFRALKRLRPETAFVDTNVATNYFWFGRRGFGRPPALFMHVEDPTKTSDTTDPDGVVYWPTTSFLEAMFRGAGFTPKRVDFRDRPTGDWTSMTDYRRGLRAAYVGVRAN